MVVPDPLPLAYAVYAFIIVDNCERPLSLLFTLYLEVGGVWVSSFAQGIS